MSDTLTIPVKTIDGNPMPFVPTEMTVRVLGNDFETGKNTVHFELRTAGGWDASIYLTRDWVSIGEVSVPSLLMAGATTEGKINVEVANQILAGFNLCIDESKLTS